MLLFTYDLGSGDIDLSLPNLNVSDGLWHVAYIRRHGNQVTLQVDGGEGRYFNETVPTDDYRLLLLNGMLFGGAGVVYRPYHKDPVVTNAMQKSKDNSHNVSLLYFFSQKCTTQALPMG